MSSMEALVIHSVLFFLLAGATSTSSTKSTTPAQFIRTSCSKTKYPDLCLSSLSSYATTIKTSPNKLATTALTVALTSAKDTSTLITSLAKATTGLTRMEAQVMKVCIENVHSSVDQLRRSVSEMNRLGGQRLGFQISNIQTWVSAALTDGNTCIDGFAGRRVTWKLKGVVRVKILRLIQLTSNALSFVNSLVALNQNFQVDGDK